MLDRHAVPIAFTYDDVLLVPATSNVLPQDADITTMLGTIALALPVLSAAMDTVTEAPMAIALARLGGLGVLHRNMPIEQQQQQVTQVKRSETGMVTEPVCLPPSAPMYQAERLMLSLGISGIPITSPAGVLLGLLTSRDVRFETRPDRCVSELMTPRDKLIVASNLAISSQAAQALMHTHRVEKLPVVAPDGALLGLMTAKDIARGAQYPTATKDQRGRLRCGAAVGVGADGLARARAVVDAGADLVVVDTAHGQHATVLATVELIADKLGDQVVVAAGNVATAAGASALAQAGARVIKAGVGAGAICTTRIVAGVGVPQLSAVMAVAEAADRFGATVVADGGIRYSGDAAKALASGADAVMLGGMLAGCTESPGEVTVVAGDAYKQYRGMGSLGAMRGRSWSKDRYFQDERTADKVVPEGVEGRVAYRGPLADTIAQVIGGLRQAMGYVGAPDLAALTTAQFVRQTAAGVRESHPHDIQITTDAPNYASPM